MLNLYFVAVGLVIFFGVNEAAYPRRSFHDIYFPLRKDASSIQPYYEDVMVMIPHKSDPSNMPNEETDPKHFRTLPTFNKMNKRHYDEGNVGKRVYLARVGKRQYYAARIG